jgi:hypothetical protein
MVRHGIEELESNFLSKPFTPIALAQKVREVLDSGNGRKARAIAGKAALVNDGSVVA